MRGWQKGEKTLFPRGARAGILNSGGVATVLGMRGLTFELSGRQRQDARARVAKMYCVPLAGPWWHAVGAPLEQVVRPCTVLPLGRPTETTFMRQVTA